MNTLEITLESLKSSRTKDAGKLTILIDGGKGDHVGIVTPEKRKNLADIYRRDYFDGIRVRLDIYRYLHFFYIDADIPTYHDVEHVEDLYRMGVIGPGNPEYAQILMRVRYSVSNNETAQLLGFILVFADMLELARTKKMTIRLEFENPFHCIENVDKLLSIIELMIKDAEGVKNMKSQTV